jgi:hypothetical protein
LVRARSSREYREFNKQPWTANNGNKTNQLEPTRSTPIMTSLCSNGNTGPKSNENDEDLAKIEHLQRNNDSNKEIEQGQREN